MKFKIFGFEFTVARQDEGEWQEHGWWACDRCGEKGRFSQAVYGESGSTKFWPSGVYRWEGFPEMRCACRRRYEEAHK